MGESNISSLVTGEPQTVEGDDKALRGGQGLGQGLGQGARSMDLALTRPHVVKAQG